MTKIFTRLLLVTFLGIFFSHSSSAERLDRDYFRSQTAFNLCALAKNIKTKNEYSLISWELGSRNLGCEMEITANDFYICNEAHHKLGRWGPDENVWVQEAKRRSLNCSNRGDYLELAQITDNVLCYFATMGAKVGSWSDWPTRQKHVQEAKRRGFSCGVGKASTTQTASATTTQSDTPTDNIIGSIWRIYEDDGEITVFHFNQDGTVAYLILSSTYNQGKTYDDGHDLWSATDDFIEISFSNGYSNMTLKFDNDENRVKGTLVLSSGEIKRVGGHLENENVKFVGGKFFNVQKPSQKTIDKQIALLKNTPKAQIASTNTTQSDTPTSAELLAAERKAEELEQQLATLKAQQEQQQQTISSDTQIPLITIASADTKGKQGVIRGRASDNVGVAEVTIDGNVVAIQSNGSFEYSTFVPPTGLTLTVQATDMAGLSSKQTVSLQRNVNLASAAISFDRLNPIGKAALKNKDAIALIIGIGSYENIIDAAYADKDALMFRDYAAEKLGIPESRIKTLINEDAEIGEVLLGIRKWIRRSAKPDKTDVYIFYAGHGIATANGEAYILPYDGRPEVDLLDRTALLQKELFAEIDKAKPRNVTIFLDACYTGKARTGEVLMADANYRPIAIRPIDDGMPDNFTLITASSGDEFSGPLEEAKHGLFSYFLMKGMEGDADSNQDNRITAGELHQFVKENVLRQSADKQTPELQGNADRVLVTFK